MESISSSPIHPQGDYRLPDTTCDKITSAAVEVIKTLGLVLLNIVTLGLYSTIKNQLMNRKIEKLEKENDDIQDEVDQEQQINNYLLNSSVEGVAGNPSLETRRLRRQVRRTREAVESTLKAVQKLQSRGAEARENLPKVEAEMDRYEGEHETLQTQLDRLSQSASEKYEEARVIQQEVDKIQRELDEALSEKYIAQFQVEEFQQRQVNELRGLQQERQAAEHRLQGLQDELQMIQDEIEEVNARLDRFQLIPSKYQMKDGDPRNIAGVYKDEASEYAQRYNGIKTMPKLIGKALETTINGLMEASDRYSHEELTGDHPPADAQDLHFNNSSTYYNNQKSRGALYQLAALELVEGADLHTDCHGPGFEELRFNDQDLLVRWSRPVVAPLEDNREIIAFQQIDEWTPEPGCDPRMGVDPISLKRIVNQLTADEKAHLRNLIQDPFMLDDNDDLQAAKDFILQEDDERAELVKNAYDLLIDIGIALADKSFGPRAQWQPTVHVVVGVNEAEENVFAELLDDEGENLGDPEPVAFVKPEEVMEVEEAEHEEWVPAWQFMTPELQEQVMITKSILDPVWQNMSEDILAPTADIVVRDGDRIPGLAEIEKQYTSKHYYGHHGCLFDGLTNLIFRRPPNAEDGQEIKNAMANYLESTDEFDEEIGEITGGWTRDDYINWLRYDNPRRNEYDNGDLELKIFGAVIGVRVGIMVQGTQIHVNDDGLIKPAGTYYGPNTTAQLTLYNVDNFTYYPIMPKVRQPVNGDREELKEALKGIHEWERHG